MEIVIGLIKEMWHVLYEASFYILFGIFFAGLIQMFVKKRTDHQAFRTE